MAAKGEGIAWLQLPAHSTVDGNLAGNTKSILTLLENCDKLLFVAEYSKNATVAQPVEQLTRNEQVVRSNRISSSKKPMILR